MVQSPRRSRCAIGSTLWPTSSGSIPTSSRSSAKLMSASPTSTRPSVTRDQLLQEEFKAAGEILTPEQQEKVSNLLADRVVVVGGDLSRLDESTITQLRETIAERLEGVAEKLGITADQKEKIRNLHAGFIPKYRDQRDKRRELRQKEYDALAALLTADQREKVKDMIGDQFDCAQGQLGSPKLTCKRQSNDRWWPKDRAAARWPPACHSLPRLGLSTCMTFGSVPHERIRESRCISFLPGIPKDGRTSSMLQMIT